jgi:hypothetical protein
VALLRFTSRFTFTLIYSDRIIHCTITYKVIALLPVAKS